MNDKTTQVFDATWDAATWGATYNVTRKATWGATMGATWSVTMGATWDVTNEFIKSL
jgi:hypothetical protein